PTMRRPLRCRFRGARTRRKAAHEIARLYLALQSARMGRDGGRAAALARFLPTARAVAARRRSLRPLVLRRRAAGRSGPVHSAPGDTRRRRSRRALVLEKLL